MIQHASSAHPSTLVRSIPYAQYIRLRRIYCTNDNKFRYHANHLRDRLLGQGYSKSLLHKAFNKAFKQPRSTLLYQHKTKSDDHATVEFITQYSYQQYQLSNVLDKHWHILYEDPILSKYVTDCPKIVFKRAISLRDKLTYPRSLCPSPRTYD